MINKAVINRAVIKRVAIILMLILNFFSILSCGNHKQKPELTSYDIGTITPNRKCFDHSTLPNCIQPIPGDRRISFAGLGIIGRFGNQLLQYMFIHLYAKRHNLVTETPEWLGSRLFGIQDPGISECFCRRGDDDSTLNSYTKTSSEVFPNVDFFGFFQWDTRHHASDRQSIQELFQPVPKLKEVVQLGVDQLHAMGNTLVAIHLRRGDFGPPPWIISPTQWYLDWLETIWPNLKNPVLFIASDELDKIVPDFKKFNPITLTNLKIEVKGADFYPEHYILSHADILAISNSTFSSTAAMLNSVATQFYRPNFRLGQLEPYQPWNSLPFVHWTNP